MGHQQHWDKSKLHFFLFQRRVLFSTFECPTFGVALQSPTGQFCGVVGGVAIEDSLFLKPLPAPVMVFFLGSGLSRFLKDTAKCWWNFFGSASWIQNDHFTASILSSVDALWDALLTLLTQFCHLQRYELFYTIKTPWWDHYLSKFWSVLFISKWKIFALLFFSFCILKLYVEPCFGPAVQKANSCIFSTHLKILNRSVLLCITYLTSTFCVPCLPSLLRSCKMCL